MWRGDIVFIDFTAIAGIKEADLKAAFRPRNELQITNYSISK